MECLDERVVRYASVFLIEAASAASDALEQIIHDSCGDGLCLDDTKRRSEKCKNSRDSGREPTIQVSCSANSR